MLGGTGRSRALYSPHSKPFLQPRRRAGIDRMGLSFETFDGRHRRIDPDAHDEVYIVGDVHGCRDALERLLDRIDPTDETLLVFVGDLVRKGPDSAGVLSLVRSRENAISVLGNNERKLLDGEASLPGLTAADRSAIAEFPLAVSWEEGLVVHGGIDPRRPIAEQSPEALLTSRSPTGNGYDGPFWFEAYDGDRRIFFGHTVFERPYRSPAAVGLDTGCVYGGQLSAFELSTGSIVTVEPTQTHVERSADSIVEPRICARS